MAEDYKSYRIRTNVGGEDNVLHVKLTQTYDTLEVLSLKIDQKNSYKTYKSDYGVVVGRVFANGGYGVPNAKVSVFIPSENTDVLNENILYPFRSVKGLDNDNIRYNLLPDFVDAACHQDVGTFPNKRMVLDNDDIIEVFDKYYTYTTTTNNAGDYMLFGVPTGMNTIHMDVDLSDIGTLSQKPRDFVYKGYNIEQFDSPTKFKSSTNLSSLAQIMSEDKEVYVYPYWGDTSDTDDDIAITRCDFELAYKFEPTCVFMGCVMTDTASNSISSKCTPAVNSGQMSELVTGSGTIEMIRKTFDNKVEQYAVNGNQNIDDNGVWCYQIPMNLDYIVTDEFGSIVPSNDPEKGIPTRARVRFRVSMNEMDSDNKARNRSRYLIPNNPRLNDRYPEFKKTKEIDYEFGTMTRDEDYCDLFWNNVYTVKNYIPRMQTNSWVKNGSRNYGGIKLISHFGDNSPMPYNQVTTRLSATYRFLCILYKFILYLVKFVNGIISYVIGGIIGIIASPFCTLAKISIFGLHPFGFFNPVCKALKKLIPSCIGIDGNVCGDNMSHAYTFYPGCGNFSSGLGIGAWINTKNSHYKNQTQEIKDGDREPDERTQPKLAYEELKNCIETSLGEEYDVISFNFNNDWINGALYMPLWWRSIRPKRSYFFGLIKKKASDTWCSSSTVYSTKKVQKVQPCAVNVNKITNGASNGCGKKNEGCMTAKSLVGFRHGYIVQKQTMLGQDVYYYASCEVDTDSSQVDRTPLKEDGNYSVKLLFATDIVLLGSLNDNDINGIPQFYKYLDSTTYKMPPTVLQATNMVSADVDEEGDVSYTQTSETEYTGRDWGNSNNDLCDSDSDTSKDGGLFYSIGCSSLRMTPKSCINASRICEFGVTLDSTTDVITKGIEYEDVDLREVTEQIIPDGYISYDDLHNEPQRSAFATLNGNNLVTTINNETGLKEYVFKYINVDNFDGNLYELMQSTQSKCSKTQKFNYYLEQKSEGYVDFRLGSEKPYYYYKGNSQGNYFPRYENSFYFYFGLKEGKTALDKLNKYYVSDCADTVATESPLKIISKGNDWCIEVESQSNTNTYNGYIGFDFTALDLPCTVLLVGTNDNNGGVDQREFIANDEKVYISTIDFNPLPEELNGYTRITKGIANDDMTMVKNDTYEIYVTDNNGEIITMVYTVGSKVMDCFITPTNFITPFNRLKERYGNVYKIMANKDFEESPIIYTSNLSRKIGGTINVTWPTDGDTNERLDNFVIKVNSDDESLNYHIRIEVRDGNVSAQTNTIINGYDALLYPRNEHSDEIGGFIIGVPQGDTNYVIEVRQTCHITEGLYVETNNRVGKSIFITDKTQYKLYINGVDYDVIKHWKSGFNVQNINSYYGTARIYEDGVISDEWFHLTDSDNYHWQESNEYNKFDKSLVDLVKAKNEVINNLAENETLFDLYNLLITTILEGECSSSYKSIVSAEQYVTNNGKNFLYYTAANNSIMHRMIGALKQGLECEIDALTNNCVIENKVTITYQDYMTLPDYGQSSYEKVYECIYKIDGYESTEDYVTMDEYDSLGDYIKKDFSYYPYEYINTKSNETVAYYGYNDLEDNEQNNCKAYNYISCSIDSDVPTVNNRPTNEDFYKYIPYKYTISGHDEQCGTETIGGATRDVFVEPGYFTVSKWVNVEQVTIGDDSTIINEGADCQHYMINKMAYSAMTVTTYIPYLGYSTLQYSNKKDDYSLVNYIKVLDVVEYGGSNHSYYVSKYGIYNYVKLKTTLEDGYVPYIVKIPRIGSGYDYQYYDQYTLNEPQSGAIIYYVKRKPETVSVGKLYSMINNWNDQSVWPYHGNSRYYELDGYAYVPLYAPLDRRTAIMCSKNDFNNMPTYGKHGYNVNVSDSMYRNYRNDSEIRDIKNKVEYDNLNQTGKNDYQTSSYLPLKLVEGASHGSINEYGDTFNLCTNCESSAVSIYDYTYNNDCTLGDGIGERINHNVYEYADYLKECYNADRYESSEGNPYHFEFDIDALEKTAEELATMTPYTKNFYRLLEYQYRIDYDVFNDEQYDISTISRRYFHKVNNENGVYYVYIPDDCDDQTAPCQLTKEGGYYILDNDDPEARILITQNGVTVVDEIEIYVNKIDNTDKIDEETLGKLTDYTIGDYAPCKYEQIVGSYSIGQCDDNNAERIDGYFDDIVAYDRAMIEQLELVVEYKNEFINLAKEAFWMSCDDNEHVLSFSAVTEDRPVNFHLVYKQEEAKENEIDGTTYNTLMATESYVCDGTTDIILTIPTICEQDEIEWGNVCHPISGQDGLCFARDNTSGNCSTIGASDAYYRKAFFVSAVNGKNELIPDGEFTSKGVPTTYFGVHVLDKRFKNHLVVWPYIKGIPLFSMDVQNSSNKPSLINMFGSIGGNFENGVTSNNELANDNMGYYSTFESQTVEGEYNYDLSLYTYSGSNREDEDRLGITRYVYAEQDSPNEIVSDTDEEDNIALSNLKNAIREAVFDLEEIVLPDDFDINTFKPFETYKIIAREYDDVDPSDYQYLQPVAGLNVLCTILPYEQFNLTITDKNNCGVSSEVNGNLEIVLDDRSMNDLRCCKGLNEPVCWGYKSMSNFGTNYVNATEENFITGGDETLLKFNIKNGDIDDFTFYAFECIVTDVNNNTQFTYPLKSNNIGQIVTENNETCQSLYQIKGDFCANGSNAVFENTEDKSKYIFGQNAYPSFDVSSVEQRFNYIHKQDQETNNLLVFNEYLINHIERGNIVNSIHSKICETETTNLLYSVNDDVTIREVMDYRNGIVRAITEDFISSEKCDSCKHCHRKWQYYKPQPQGQVLRNGTELNYIEYDNYIGFSRSGEFIVDSDLTLYYSNTLSDSQIYYIMPKNPKEIDIDWPYLDDCEQYDDGKSTVFRVKTCGHMDSTKSHTLFYVVAISNDGMRRAISPVYDLRRNEIVYHKIKIGDKYYYQINVKNPENRYYFWHYDYMVNYDIDFGRMVEESSQDDEGNIITRIVFQSDVKVTGILQHPAEKTNSIVTMDCLIEIPSREEWGGTEPKIEGTITFKDNVGLKHVFKTERDKNDINAETVTELHTYTFKTGGGKWINTIDNNITFNIPENYLNTSKDYVIMAENYNQQWKTDLGKQLQREEFGVTYDFDGWNEESTGSNKVCTAKWKYNEESAVGDLIYDITWKWKEGTVDAQYTAKAVSGVYVSLPSSINPTRIVEINGVKMEYQQKWNIPLAMDDPDDPQDYAIINSADYFIAGDRTYNWGDNNTIELSAEYAEPKTLTVYFIDDGIDYDRTGNKADYIHEQHVQIGEKEYDDVAKTTVDSGTNIDYFNQSNFFFGPVRIDSSDFPYTLVKWETDTTETAIVVDNTIVQGVWNFNLKLLVQYAIKDIDNQNKSLTRCIIKIQNGVTVEMHTLNISNIIVDDNTSFVEETITYRFSNGETKSRPPIGNNNSLIKIKEIYISLDEESNYCFFVETTQSTINYMGRDYTVCDSGCTKTIEPDNTTCKITFSDISPKQNV